MRNSCVVEEEKERKKKRNEWSGKLFQGDEVQNWVEIHLGINPSSEEA